MAKREIPLFIFDLARDHNLGECDFVSCTDVDNAFVAKIDYVTGHEPVVTDDTRIVRENQGIQLRLQIKRITGKNPDKAAIRTLLKKAEDLYVQRTQKKVHVNEPTTDEMIDFLEALINGNKHLISKAGVDNNEREIILTSISMLESIKDKLDDEQQDNDRLADC